MIFRKSGKLKFSVVVFIIHVQYTQTESIRPRHFTTRLDSHGVDPHYLMIHEPSSVVLKTWQRSSVDSSDVLHDSTRYIVDVPCKSGKSNLGRQWRGVEFIVSRIGPCMQVPRVWICCDSSRFALFVANRLLHSRIVTGNLFALGNNAGCEIAAVRTVLFISDPAFILKQFAWQPPFTDFVEEMAGFLEDCIRLFRFLLLGSSRRAPVLKCTRFLSFFYRGPAGGWGTGLIMQTVSVVFSTLHC